MYGLFVFVVLVEPAGCVGSGRPLTLNALAAIFLVVLTRDRLPPTPSSPPLSFDQAPTTTRTVRTSLLRLCRHSLRGSDPSNDNNSSTRPYGKNCVARSMPSTPWCVRRPPKRRQQPERKRDAINRSCPSVSRVMHHLLRQMSEKCAVLPRPTAVFSNTHLLELPHNIIEKANFLLYSLTCSRLCVGPT